MLSKAQQISLVQQFFQMIFSFFSHLPAFH